jgi:hypothetical protein
MKEGTATPIIRHDGRQVITFVCKTETTTITSSTTTTLGPAVLFVPAADSALGLYIADPDIAAAYAANPNDVMNEWMTNPSRTEAELLERETELLTQHTICKVRCAIFDRNLHSRLPLVPTPARFKRAVKRAGV